jgi:glutamyl-tRNA(Gln) amidotransferase subunit E
MQFRGVQGSITAIGLFFKGKYKNARQGTTVMVGAVEGGKDSLKVGLEIHQQAGSPGESKLFCRCPADIIERQPDITVTRRLRASAGETGVVDAAAAAEARKAKRYTYHAFNDGTCLVELDEEPPSPVNAEVIKTAAMVAKACGSTVLPMMQFMRKTIVDGSAVSGFQRTGLFAIGGIIPEVAPPVRLQTICIEEDSAKIVARTPEEDIYNLSRNGIPLIEIATEPDITSASQAQEVAAALGLLLRSTKRVKRGLGTIRQDLNVSVPGGTRVEIKGAQDLRMIATLIENEAERQRSLIVLASKLRQVEVGDIIDVTEAFHLSTVSFIKSALARGDCAVGVKVSGFAGVLGTELVRGYRVGSELADLARSAGFGGLIHSDEDLKKYGVGKEDLSHAFSLGEKDAFLLLIGDSARIQVLLEDAILPRLRQFAVGVPKEVRKANPDGTTSFLRPMPGAARMYPETDVPIVAIDVSAVEAPKLFSEQVRDMQLSGISEDQAKQLVREGIIFDEYLEKYPSLEPSFIATAVLTYGKEIQARYKKEIDHIALLEPLFAAVMRNQIPRSAVFEILVEIAEGKAAIGNLDYSRYAPISDEELRAAIRSAMAELPDAKPSVIMGKVMAKARGKAEGKRVMELIERERSMI